MRGQQDPRLDDYLGHMRDAIGRIERYTSGLDEAEFVADSKTQDAVVRNFEILGEASNKIQVRFPDFSKKYPEIPLAQAYKMRIVLAHGYFKVDLHLVWKTIHEDLPKLREQVVKAISEGTPPPPTAG